MQFVFAAERCKPKTNDCSANTAVLQAVVPLVTMRTEEL